MSRKFPGNRLTVLAAAFMLTVTSIGTSVAFASDKTVEQVYLGEPRYVYWESDTVGRWSSVSKAHEYQVKLYVSDYVERDEENWRKIDWEDEDLEAVMTRRTTELNCDFTEYMKDGYSYFFVVRATPKIGEQAYTTSGSWTASPDMDFKGRQVQGVTEGKWRNYLDGSRYELPDGTYLQEGWQLIKGSWYLLDDAGYRLSGWQEIDGSRYYLDAGGKMQTGWFLYEDNWYYTDDSGVMQTGWIMEQPGVYYYLQEDGKLVADEEAEG